MSPRMLSPQEFEKREAELISISRELFERECPSTFTIDKLVDASPYSKGTVYKHFEGKEDVMMAVCNACFRDLRELFEKALTFKGRSREKLLSVLVSYIIWAKLRPYQLFIVLSAHSPNVTANTSEKYQQQHHECEEQMMTLMCGEIAKAVEQGDLVLSENMTLEQVTFALWSATWGSMALIISKGTSSQLQAMELERETFTNGRLIFDGLNWKPLSSEMNYKETLNRIVKELFSEEVAELEKMGTPFSY
ncbi:MAG: TetR/AcrR family transcriptional regulator [Gammaproteobacteria bacterium]|nr:TetR/AcrR family transcriptional regulator [Gammaproteobacteria bacterium]MDH5630008.1 TetR/AcrR family transcriptional regulator [Gammaproteobacteria bacterium]